MNEWQILGVVVAVIVMIGGIIMRDRQVINKIHEGDAEIHKRINSVQHDFVRRDDMNGHVQIIENSVTQMREEQRETNRRIDNLLTILSHKQKEI